jgi:hypothetical protein
MLWRVMRSQIDSSGNNNPQNDMLVDVLRDPGAPGSTSTSWNSTLDRGPRPGSQGHHGHHRRS